MKNTDFQVQSWDYRLACWQNVGQPIGGRREAFRALQRSGGLWRRVVALPSGKVVLDESRELTRKE